MATPALRTVFLPTVTSVHPFPFFQFIKLIFQEKLEHEIGDENCWRKKHLTLQRLISFKWIKSNKGHEMSVWKEYHEWRDMDFLQMWRFFKGFKYQFIHDVINGRPLTAIESLFNWPNFLKDIQLNSFIANSSF